MFYNPNALNAYITITEATFGGKSSEHFLVKLEHSFVDKVNKSATSNTNLPNTSNINLIECSMNSTNIANNFNANPMNPVSMPNDFKFSDNKMVMYDKNKAFFLIENKTCLSQYLNKQISKKELLRLCRSNKPIETEHVEINQKNSNDDDSGSESSYHNSEENII
jgi:hypothetical protein